MQQQDLIAGDSLNFLTSVPQYPASSGWVLSYRLVPRTGGATPVDITATAEGDDFRVAVPATVTAEWTADAYTWFSWVDKAGESYTVGDGQLTVKPNPRTAAAGYDGRSQARKALDDARAAFAAWTPTRRRYKIGEREMDFSSPADIIKTITYWEQQVATEDRLAGTSVQLGRRIFARI